MANGRSPALLPRHRHALGARALPRDRRLRALPSAGAKLAGWLGLVPSLDQSGESRRQGAITKTGSGYARRLLVEAAWHYLPQPSVGPALAERRSGQPDHVIQIALRAQRRLHRLYHRLRERGKPGNVATVAVARELACVLWAAAVAE